jgi:hypothetical protein
MANTNAGMLGMPPAVFAKWKVHKAAATAERANPARGGVAGEPRAPRRGGGGGGGGGGAAAAAAAQNAWSGSDTDE